MFYFLFVGKYYLGDVGYGIRKGIIFPFRGVRYHLNEFTKYSPKNKKGVI